MKKVFKKVSFMLLATWSIQLENFLGFFGMTTWSIQLENFLGFFGMGQKTNSTIMQPTQRLSDNPVKLDSILLH